MKPKLAGNEGRLPISHEKPLREQDTVILSALSLYSFESPPNIAFVYNHTLLKVTTRKDTYIELTILSTIYPCTKMT